MKHSLIISAVMGSTLLGGCTTSLTTVPEKAGPAAAVAPGIPYRLPMTQVELALTWTVTGCETWTVTRVGDRIESAVGISADGRALGPLSGADAAAIPNRTEFGLGVTAAASHKVEIVEGESFLIDYSELTNAFKKGQVTVAYHEDTLLLKSINAEIEGKEAEALGTALKLGANVARIAFGLPPAPGGGTSGPQGVASTQQVYSACTPQTIEAVAALASAASKMEGLTKRAGEIAAELEVLKTRAIVGPLTDDDKIKYKDRDEEAQALKNSLTELKTLSQSLRNRLSLTHTWRFPEKIRLRSDRLSPDQQKAEKWLEPLLTAAAYSDLFRPQRGSFARFRQEIEVEADLAPLVAEYACGNDSTGGCAEPPVGNGLYFRQPVQAKLRLVRKGQDPLVSETVLVPQMGRLRRLPLESDWGEKNGLSAEFTRAGAPTKIEYKVLEAPGLQALSIGNDAAASFLALRGEVRAAEEAEAEAAVEEEKAQLESLKREIELLQSRISLQQLQAVQPQTITDLNADLAILRLEKEKSELEAAIRLNKAK